MSFDLDKAVAAWRHQFAHRRSFLPEDLDELERHLRDHTEHLVARGTKQEEAFEAAVQEIGEFEDAEEEYGKVFWGKLRRRRRLLAEIQWRLDMLRNYVVIGVRNLRRQAGYTFINVGGFAIGLVCVFLIVIYVQHELSFDRFHEKADRIYLLTYTSEHDGAERVSSYFPASKGPRLEEAFPEVAHAIRYWDSSIIARVGSETEVISPFFPVDAAFFRTFSFSLVRGDPRTVLEAPNAAVLTESQAVALFGSADPIGKILSVVSFTEPHELVVTGVMADPPTNSFFSQIKGVYRFEALAAHFGREAILDGHSGPSNFNIFVELEPGTDPDAFSAHSLDFVKREFQPPADAPGRLVLHPLTELHIGDEARRSLTIFAMVALLTLLIACANFTNLATARAVKRAKEVGIRKAVGAHRSQLVGQFLAESVLLSALSIVLALVLTLFLLPAFADLIGQTFTIDLGQNIEVIAILLGIGLMAGIMAGSYPAIYLSSFRPARVLKDIADGGRSAARLRKGLIIFQFAISAFLMVGTLTVHDQLRYMKDRPLGFEKEHVVFANTSPVLRERLDVFTSQLAQHPGVIGVTAANSVPGRFGSTRGYVLPQRSEVPHVFHTLYADPEYLNVLGLSLQTGRFLSEDIALDKTTSALVNETAVRQLGLQEPLGQVLVEGDRTLEIVGVVRDFHFQSLTQEIQPLVIQMDPSQAWFVAARLDQRQVDAALAHLEETWRAFDPNRPFSAFFLDDVFDRLYNRQERQGRLFNVFAFLAVFIACLGLLGLAAFSAEQRTKEIGIRKVLGAGIGNIVFLLLRDLTTLVAISVIVAVPIAYVVMSRWLEDFAYRMELGVGIFLIAGGTLLAIAAGTVSFQALRAALADPVTNLRHE